MLSRLVLAVAVLAALVVLSLRTTSSAASAEAPVPCTTAALARAFDGQFHLSSIQNYGCEGEWAYVWATVGTGAHAIGVTEVLADVYKRQVAGSDHPNLRLRLLLRCTN